jgi:hypothetical protein
VRRLPDSVLHDPRNVAIFRARIEGIEPYGDGCIILVDGWTRSRISIHLDESGPKYSVPAHRLALGLKLGHWPIHNACHDCDTPGCANAEHLFDGTQDDNMQDAIRKGRFDARNAGAAGMSIEAWRARERERAAAADR